MGADAATTDQMLFYGLEGGFRFVFPTGGHVVDDGPFWFAEGYYGIDTDQQAAVMRRLADELADLLDGIAAVRAGAMPPVVVGASQGGDLAAALAVLHPNRISAAVAVAASLPPEIPTTFAVKAPLWLFHGTADSVVPVDKTRALAAALHRIIRDAVAGGAVGLRELALGH